MVQHVDSAYLLTKCCAIKNKEKKRNYALDYTGLLCCVLCYAVCRLSGGLPWRGSGFPTDGTASSGAFWAKYASRFSRTASTSIGIKLWVDQVNRASEVPDVSFFLLQLFFRFLPRQTRCYYNEFPCNKVTYFVSKGFWSCHHVHLLHNR